MKRLYKGACVIIAFLLIVPIISMAKEGVPQIALDARASVFRVLCEDSEYTYSGSSFVVASDEEGTYLATNYHVVEDARPNSIVTILHDGSKVPAQIVEYTKEYDLCILKTDNKIEGAQPLTLANSAAISTGTAVYALGFPGAADYLTDDYAFSVDEITVTDGIVSAIKHITTDGAEVTLLQMNAAINAGSSGGPLVNEAGQVVGINALGIKNASDIFAAIHIQHLIDLLKKANIPYSAPAAEASVKPLPKFVVPTWGWGIAGALLLAGIAFLCIKLTRRKLTLAVLMDRRLQGYSFEETIEKLRPVLGALVPLHVRGEAHGNINPWNIFVDRNGNLTLGRRSKRRNLNERIKPYIPMEEYSSDSVAGTYSDVYAIGAVMLFMLGHKPPADVFTRLQNDTANDQLNEILALTEEQRHHVTASLALKKEERLHDVGTLLNALRVDNIPITGGKIRKLPVRQARTRKPIHWRKVFIGTGISAVIIVIAVVFGLNIIHYNRTIACLGKKDYTAARQEITGSFLFYKDTDKLSYYINTVYFLQEGYFDEAKTRFQALGTYRDSQQMALECDYQKAKKFLKDGDLNQAKTMFGALGDYSDSKAMVSECDYREAKQLLGLGKYDEAKALFSQLADANYKDAKTMALETDYQNALAIYKRYIAAPDENKSYNDMQQMLSLFQAAGSYLDAPQKLAEVKSLIYNRATDIFAKCFNYLDMTYRTEDELLDGLMDYDNNLSRAEKIFYLVADYLNTSKYLDVIKILDGDSKAQEKYDILMELWDFPAAQRVITSKDYIDYFLRGTWRGDGHYFKLTIGKDDKSSIAYDIPWISGDYYYISDLTLYCGSDEKGWREMLQFYVVNEYTIRIYSFKSGRSYSLARQ